jgi:NADPH:quinone reductase-like Zn-dependent oxidoreductase
MPDDGTFAEAVAVPVEQLFPKPGHLSWSEAAALPLAGLTAYRALFSQGGLKGGEKLLITGVGGGVATLALQLAVAVGANVWVTSSSPSKIEYAVALGAKGGFLYTDEGWSEDVSNTVGAPDLILDSAGGEGYAVLVQLAAQGGRIVNYGATAGVPEKLDLFKVYWRQLRLIGSTMGSRDDFAAMLELVAKHEVKPVVDRAMPLADGAAAIERMRRSPQFGKMVLEIAS